MMGVANPPPPDLPGTDEREPTLAGASRGDQLDAVAPLTDPEEDEATLPVFSTLANAESESEVESISLRSDDDEPYAIPSVAKPSVADDTSRCGSPNPTATDLHDVYRRAAKKLGIEWPETLTEITTSRYEGKRLPRAKSSSRQLLPVFPECLEEATRSWSNPLTAKNPALGGSALDWTGMEAGGFLHLPPIEPLLASHLHPSQKSAMTAAGPTLPFKADSFQSALNEKGYKAVAASVKALNASSLLLAYQAELQEQMTGTPMADLWDELCVVTDLCLRLHRSGVQASGRAMALMVTQERARWLNLSSLSQREKNQLLDTPVDPKSLFGPTVAAMQKRCEEKKREGEVQHKRAVRLVPQEQSRDGFYSRYFLVPKRVCDRYWMCGL
ncbi:uncharacterized protein LOC124863505 [Girardinichthys multiradiatus]|uniref:uncharacterized protein LOC124863505 n=1 Tax=Girardinichthys multiradiatus TaxID=208333 RepID=UPI001FAD904C|nr:uncharacterized protein LOC124863505 [Girardinichthys multiradiatus]